ncbi:MAG: response regulator [Dehalococcoidia bacterium]|jgi:CheY-like chemotaxis protein|nr:response regulator [Dehalococcoidia bacterium]
MQENVLVVDDHPEIRDLIVEILEKRGYQVSTASNGHDALTQFALDRPDPGDHRSVDAWNERLPIVLAHTRNLFGSSADDERPKGRGKKAYEMGADAFVSKPFDMEALWAEIDELLPETCRLTIG